MTRDRRYVIPFPNGITVPTQEFTVEYHDKKLTFPVSYLPFITGALKVLARPETYQSDTPSELNFSVQQGMDILASIEDNLLASNILYGEVDVSTFYGWTSIGEVDTCNGDYVINTAISDDLDGSSQIDLVVKQNPDHTLAGGHVKFDVYFWPEAAKVFTLTGHRCSSTVYDSGFTPIGEYHYEQTDVKDLTFTISAVYAILVNIRISGLPVCGDV